MTDKPIFTRPIEIQNSTSYYSIDYNIGGGGWAARDINPGVYANIAALLEAMETAANATPLTKTLAWLLVEDTTNGIVKARCSNQTDDTTFLIRLGTALSQILGEPADTWESVATDPQTASYAPSHVWIPRFQVASQDRFKKRSAEFIKGVTVKTGQNVGNKTGPQLYYRRMIYTNELAKNIFDEAAETVVSGYNVDEDRNLQTFLEGAMGDSPTDAGNPSPRGFFFYNDWNNIIDTPEDVPGGTTGIATTYEGINFDLSSSADRFAWCQFASNPMPDPGPSGPTGKNLYSTQEFEIHTQESMPTWQAPDQT